MELLIVIVIIGILAAIVIVAYNGIAQRAHATAIQSDLSNGASALGISQATDGKYPANGSDANGGQGLKASPGNSFIYNPSGDGTAYCLQASGYGMSYFITSDNTTPQGGVCNGTSGLAGDPSNPPHLPMVSTLAGSGTAGSADGTGSAAQLNNPAGVAIDSSGTVYVADWGDYRIRKITSAGVVTTLAGSGTVGFADGTGSAAQFNNPVSVAVDSSGTVYVGDYYNNRVRKITSAGVVTTLAGSGVAGSADGTGSAAQFNYPYGVAVDSSGTVYVADSFGNRIRKITSAGVVTTLAGSGTAGFADGTGSAAQFNYPNGVAVDSSGTVYVADAGNNRIRKITPSGVVTTLAGSGVAGFADGTGTAAQFDGSRGVAVDSSGTVYVSDLNNQRIRKITPSGVVTTLAGSGTTGFADGTGSTAQFNSPNGVAVDSSGTVYVADYGNNRVRVIK